DAGLAHAGHDHAPAAAVEQLHRPLEARVELAHEAEDGLRLHAQYARVDRPHVDALRRLHRRSAPWMASSSSSNGGRSSIRSMLGPSDSGRPSRSVRSGSSCISMKSASTPNATAARASAGTYLRSPPERSPAPPGSCTECVASNTTGTPSARMSASPRMSTTRLL